MKRLGAAIGFCLLAADPGVGAAQRPPDPPAKQHTVLGFARDFVDCFEGFEHLEARRCGEVDFSFPQPGPEWSYRIELSDQHQRKWWVRRGDVRTDAHVFASPPSTEPKPDGNASRS